MKSPLGYEMNCPKCGKRLEYAFLDGNGNHLLLCYDHGMVQLHKDGKVVVESDLLEDRNERQLNREKDVTADIKKELPKALLEKLLDIEKFTKKPIQFVQQCELYGGAMGMFSIDGKIWVSAAAKKEWGVVGEEIMHFYWRTSGLPRMKPAGNDELGVAIDQIGGHFEEHVFFPFLQELGFTPRAAVDAAMPATADTLSGVAAKRIKDEGDTEFLRTYLAAKFVQASLMTSGTSGEQVVKVFEHEALKPFAEIGAAIRDEILAMNPRDSADIKERMERTLYTHLRLDKSLAEVKPAFQVKNVDDKEK